MRTVTKRQAHAWTVAASVLAVVTVPAAAGDSAACGCPDDGHSAVAIGLGQAFPQTTNLSLSPAWRVYAFEREGIRYLQVNNLDGKARAAVGYVGETFWVLPVGMDLVSTPQRPLKIPADAARLVVYRSRAFELAVYTTSHGVLWAVELPAQ